MTRSKIGCALGIPVRELAREREGRAEKGNTAAAFGVILGEGQRLKNGASVTFQRGVWRELRYRNHVAGNHYATTSEILALLRPPRHHADALFPIVSAGIGAAHQIIIDMRELALDGVGVP